MIKNVEEYKEETWGIKKSSMVRDDMNAKI